ncbi:MAG: DNA alkylation repair protein [Saprospiraceae bacterium]|nr:DNA alkylation repair protein [Saprospiraceae bacterium]
MNKQFSVEVYLNALRCVLNEQGNPEYALKQMNYMKNYFDFYGLNAPSWLRLSKDFFDRYGVFEGEALKTFVRLCFDEPQRELHYIALEMVQRQLKQQPEAFIFFLEELILTKSWWDSVDWLAKLVAAHFSHFPHQIRPTTEGWISHENIWLQRMAITFQRYFKEKTDEKMLFDYIQRTAHSKEFFIQKGAGWALREYAKINPSAVIAFCETTELASLTRREALRRLDI